MNAKNVAVILAVVCAVLLGGLIYRHRQAVEQKTADEVKILDYSNNWVTTRTTLQQQNDSLRQGLEESRTAGTQLSNLLVSASNLLARTEADLSKTSTDLSQSQSALQAATNEIARNEARIAELTTQNAALDKQAGDLQTSIKGLEQAITETKRKLDSAEGDKVVLQAELKRLLAEKAELERQFNDITVLRTQLAKLKEELTIARRLDWIRRGLYGDAKGGQRMLQLGRETEQASQPAKTNFDLNVEVRSDGSLKIIPPPDKPLPSGQ